MLEVIGNVATILGTGLGGYVLALMSWPRLYRYLRRPARPTEAWKGPR